MEGKKQNESRINRRKTLTTTASVLTGGAILTTIGSANNADGNKMSEKDRYNVAMEARRKTGENELFREILSEGSVEMATKDLEIITTWSSAQPAEGEVSTEKLTESKFDVELTMFRKMGSDNIFADAKWEHEVDYSLSGNEAGEPPHDYAGLAFEHTDYDLEGWSSGISTEKDTYNSEGVAFEYCDACCEQYERAAGDCTPDGETFTIWDYCQIEVTPDQETDPSKRKVFFDYHHTYSDVEVETISISYNGLSVTVSDMTKKWHEDTHISEDELKFHGP